MPDSAALMPANDWFLSAMSLSKQVLIVLNVLPAVKAVDAFKTIPMAFDDPALVVLNFHLL